MSVERVAISLPAHLYREIEAERQVSGQTRSQLVAEAVAAYLTARREKADAEAYRRSYELFPETDEEVEAADRQAMAVFASLPWDETDKDSAGRAE